MAVAATAVAAAVLAPATVGAMVAAMVVATLAGVRVRTLATRKAALPRSMRATRMPSRKHPAHHGHSSSTKMHNRQAMFRRASHRPANPRVATAATTAAVRVLRVAAVVVADAADLAAATSALTVDKRRANQP